MGIFDRILLTLFTIAMAVLAASLIGVALNWLAPFSLLLRVLETTEGRLVTGIVGAVWLIVSLRFLWYGFSRRQSSQTVVHETALGEVRVSVGAVRNLVSRVARQVKGVRDVRANVRHTPQGIEAEVQLVISPEASVPEVSDEVQKSVRNYVKNVVGVGVTEVRVYVENISNETRRIRG
ncbi:MAG: alkaline shock response membrane anchor protein AmaP [Bacillota bacterium]